MADLVRIIVVFISLTTESISVDARDIKIHTLAIPHYMLRTKFNKVILNETNKISLYSEDNFSQLSINFASQYNLLPYNVTQNRNNLIFRVGFSKVMPRDANKLA